MPTHELELELEQELEQELEGAHEFEFEHEQELEGEQFFGQLARLAMRGARSPALRRIALSAARSALGSMLREHEGEFEGEFEYEFEGEFEGEQLNPIKRVYPDAMMEHMAHAAAEAESEQEAAEAFLPLIPLLAAKILPLAAKAVPMLMKSAPKIASTLMRNAPRLTRGVTSMARTLFRSPTTRPLLRTIPAIARRTMLDVARQTARGRTMSPQAISRSLAQNAARTLSSPQQCVHAYRRSQALDRQLHRAHPSVLTPGATQGVGCTCARRVQRRRCNCQ